jgi:hypothetical protein
VSVHARRFESCGGPDINLWGLFRVDQAGQLTPVKLRPLAPLYSIERLVDLDGDGDFELIGRDWLGLERILTSSAGVELQRLRTPFFGCPC